MLEAYEEMDNIHFVLKANSITSGVEEDIRDYLTLHPNIKLVVIDTLQHIRGNEFVKKHLRRGRRVYQHPAPDKYGV